MIHYEHKVKSDPHLEDANTGTLWVLVKYRKKHHLNNWPVFSQLGTV